MSATQSQHSGRHKLAALFRQHLAIIFETQPVRVENIFNTDWLLSLVHPLKLFRILALILIKHAQICLYCFDSIHDVPIGTLATDLPHYRYHRVQVESRSIHRYFALPILVSLYIATDTVVMMGRDNFDYYHRPMPALFTHRMYAPSFWSQGDILWFTAILDVLLLSLTFLIQPWLDDKYCMYFVEGPENGQNLELVVNRKGV